MATDVPGITHLTGLNVNFLSHRMTGNASETMISCPISIPILKDNSEWLIGFHIIVEATGITEMFKLDNTYKRKETADNQS